MAALAAGCIGSLTWAGPSIVIGHSLSLSAKGADKQRADRVLEGTEAYLAAVNRSGGINGKPVVLRTLDDTGSSGTAKKNVEQLAADGSVVALLNMAGGGTCVGVIPVVQQARIPMLGCMAGSPQLRSPFHAYVFNIRPGHDLEYYAMAEQAASLGVKTAVFVHDDTDTGRLHLDNAKKAVAASGLTLVGNHAISKKSSVEAVVADIVKSKPGLVFNQGPNDFFSSVIAGAREGGSYSLFMSVTSGADTVVNLLKDKSRGVMFTQVVPFPFVTDVRRPLIADYHRDLKASFPDRSPSYDSFESYINARVMVEALKRAGSAPSRESIKEALESFTDLDVGGFRVQFGKDRRTASKYTEMVMATNTERKFMK